MTQGSRMSAGELRASLGLAGVFGLRMFGLFIVLPVLALYTEHLPGGDNHALVGLAIGAYGLAQACLQVPSGWLSDRWGRKRTIYLGLAVFAVGSVVAAMASDIAGIILGRTIQGAGAISAAAIALTADLTRDDQRTKAMALIGLTIGASFALSMVGGPVLSGLVGVPGIFVLTGALALAAAAVVRWVVPEPPLAAHPRGEAARSLSALLRNPQLLRLNYGIFVLHSILMAMWVVVPFSLRDNGLPAAEHWKVYLPVMLGSVALMVPAMLMAERRGHRKAALLGGIGVLILAQLALAYAQHSLWEIGFALLIFFAGFNLLEASLPALVSRTAPAAAKGAAIGIYSSVQFLGTFAGGAVGGLTAQHLGARGVFAVCGAAALSWLLVAAGMVLPAGAQLSGGVKWRPSTKSS